MNKLFKELFYLNWVLFNKNKTVKNLPVFNYYLGLSLRISSIIYIILLAIILLINPNFYINVLGKIVHSTPVKFFIIFTITFLPLDVFIYKFYVKYEKEFTMRLKKERLKDKKYRSDNILDINYTKKIFGNDYSKKEYCIDCKKSFSEVKRFENTNLCEKCFNKELKEDDISKKEEQHTLH